jgi:hypothetical protein
MVNALPMDMPAPNKALDRYKKSAHASLLF